MGILDDAIREHLDLKRKHGARDSELREIEDEALGSGEQPDPFAAGEVFTEVSPGEAAPGEGGGPGTAAPSPGPAAPLPDIGEPSAGGEEPTRLVEPAEPISPPEGLREVPADEEPIPAPERQEEPIPGQERPEEPIPGQERLEEPIPGQERLPELGQEEGYAVPEVPVEPSSEEIEPPAPSESLEELIAEEEPFPEDAEAPEPGPAAEVTEEPDLGAESSVPEPPPPPPPGAEPPGRARGRVDVPTQEHPPPGDTGGVAPIPAEEEPEALGPQAGSPELYDFETDEDLLEPAVPVGETDDDFEALGPAEEQAPSLEEEEPYSEEPVAPVEPPVGEEAYEGQSLDPEETYEEDTDDDLWFEKGPPKDFDFEDEDR
jgi:hypothetical protein